VLGRTGHNRFNQLCSFVCITDTCTDNPRGLIAVTCADFTPDQ
jgi:hypothetical protein